jgi:hypothetical protein
MAELFERPESEIEILVSELLEHGLLVEVPPGKGN